MSSRELVVNLEQDFRWAERCERLTLRLQAAVTAKQVRRGERNVLRHWGSLPVRLNGCASCNHTGDGLPSLCEHF